MMKRSHSFRPITIGLIGASAFALSACKQDEEQATAFPDLKACLAQSAQPGATVTEDQCTTAYAQAVETNQQSAPRYDAMAACEEQHGAGNCQQAESSSGFGSVFLPIVTGFLLGKMLSGGGLMGQPMYNKAGGGFTTPGGGFFGANRGTSVVPGSTFNKPAPTFNKPPMSSKSFTSSGSGWNNSQSTVKSQGGFGSSFNGGGSLGG